MGEYPSYYSVIPARVRYDKELRPLARLLYGEISALCNERGYCWAENHWFAELFEKTTKTISELINSLKNRGHIVVEFVDSPDGRSSPQRRIWVDAYYMNEEFKPPILPGNSHLESEDAPSDFSEGPSPKSGGTPPEKTGYPSRFFGSPPPDFSEGPLPKNVKHNNTRLIIQENNNTPIVPKGKRGKKTAPVVLRSFENYSACSLPELREALYAFAAFREAKGNPLLTQRAATYLQNVLDEESKGDDRLKVAMLDQSIFRNWDGVFPLKGDGGPTPASGSGGAKPHVEVDEWI